MAPKILPAAAETADEKLFFHACHFRRGIGRCGSDQQGGSQDKQYGPARRTWSAGRDYRGPLCSSWRAAPFSEREPLMFSEKKSRLERERQRKFAQLEKRAERKRLRQAAAITAPQAAQEARKPGK